MIGRSVSRQHRDVLRVVARQIAFRHHRTESRGCVRYAQPCGARPECRAVWPQWRGPYANGASRTAKPPIEWSETRYVKWKVEIPGRGAATPVIWNDRIYLLTAVPIGLSAQEARTQREAASSPDTSMASSRWPSIVAMATLSGEF
jgi:hypothetical protein